ncbi:hypothetical protein AGMMS49975_28000 [Clostridia bacterium]|nr:hypothetical protein AGMMS49975_28000 [Clostridia bacterium]
MEIPVIEIDNHSVDFTAVKDDIKSQKIERGVVVNKDTGLTINVTRAGLNDTYMYAERYERRNKGADAYARINALYKLKDILENAVLLDTIVSEKGENNGFYAPFL